MVQGKADIRSSSKKLNDVKQHYKEKLINLNDATFFDEWLAQLAQWYAAN